MSADMTPREMREMLAGGAAPKRKPGRPLTYPEPMVSRSVKLSAALWRTLAEKAHEERVSVGAVIRRLLEGIRTGP